MDTTAATMVVVIIPEERLVFRTIKPDHMAEERMELVLIAVWQELQLQLLEEQMLMVTSLLMKEAGLTEQIAITVQLLNQELRDLQRHKLDQQGLKVRLQLGLHRAILLRQGLKVREAVVLPLLEAAAAVQDQQDQAEVNF